MPGSRKLKWAALWAALAPAVANADLTVDAFDHPGPVPLVGDVYQVTDDLGRYSDGNESLFHSFSDFVIEAHRAAEFTSMNFVDQMVIRHTGTELAQILGEFRSLVMSSASEGADVYFLSPSGIVVGDQASLNVPASFHLSTAQSLVFPDHNFDATGASDGPNGPMLSTAAPEAFGFGPGAARQIEFEAVQGFGVNEMEVLSVIGGGVVMFGAPGDNIQAPGATVQIASVAEVDPGESIEVPIDLTQFDAQGATAFGELGDVLISRDFVIDVSTPINTDVIPAGSVVIRAEQFSLANSDILARHRVDNIDAPHAIDIEATLDTGAPSIDIAFGSRLQALTEGDGAAGDISLAAPTVAIRGQGTKILISSEDGGAGAVGSLEIDAGEITLSDGAVIETLKESPGVPSEAVNDGGLVHLAGGEVLITSGARVLSRTTGTARGGRIHIEGESLKVSGGADIVTATQLFDGAEGGPIELETDSVWITDAGAILSQSQNQNVNGIGGALHFDTGSLVVDEGGRVGTEALVFAPGGDIHIVADSVRVSNESQRADNAFISTNTKGFMSGARGGDIEIRTGSLQLVDGGQVFTQTDSFVDADAGDLRIQQTGSVLASGRDDQNRPAGLFTRSLANSQGDGGLLFVDAENVQVLNGAHFSASTFGEGNSGNVEIMNAKSVEIRGGEDGFSIVTAESIGNVANLGNAGSVSIESDQLVLADGGLITTLTSGPGRAGDVEAHAKLISVSGHVPGNALIPSGIFATSDQAAGGDGGTIRLFTGDLLVFDGGRITVQTRSELGNAGSILVDASGVVELSSGGEILALSGPASLGEGGSIDIRAGKHVTLAGLSRISSESEGAGNAGAIQIDAGGTFSATDSRVTTQSSNAAGGQIEIVADDMIYLLDSAIETDVASGDDGGGNVELHGGVADVNSPLDESEAEPADFVVLNHSEITSTAVGGDGGNITIVANSFIRSGDSVLDASSELGIDGEIATGTPEEDITTNVQPLTATFLDASKLLANACAARGTRSGSFTVGGAETLMAAPDAALAPIDASAAGSLEMGPCSPL